MRETEHMTARERLRYHVTGAIERGEGGAIVGIDDPDPRLCADVGTAVVRPTDCRTGYQVWFGGKLYLTVRRREEAIRIAAKLNG